MSLLRHVSILVILLLLNSVDAGRSNKSKSFASELVSRSFKNGTSLASAHHSLNSDVGSKNEYHKSCTMANLLIATRQDRETHRYAYGLTINCVFFFFDMEEYLTIEKALEYVSFILINNLCRILVSSAMGFPRIKNACHLSCGYVRSAICRATG